MGGTASSANVGSGDVVSRRFRMTTDEAANILNLKKEAIFKAEGPSTEVLEELLAVSLALLSRSRAKSCVG